MTRIGWLSTGRDPAARNLLSEVNMRAARDGLPLRIEAVFCDRAPGESLESDLFLGLVDTFGLRAVTLSSAASWREAQLSGADREAWRSAFHDKVMRSLDPYRLDVLVLAGYMLIVSPAMCARYAMLNLHPALPGGPTGTWQQVIWQLLREEAHETGALINLVTPDLDRGPVVAFDRFPIAGSAYDTLWGQFREKTARQGFDRVVASEGEDEPLFAAIRREGERREIPLLYQTIAQFLRGRLRVDPATEGKAAMVTGDQSLPLDLTNEVSGEVGDRAARGGRR